MRNTKEMTLNERAELERYIDEFTLQGVINVLYEICHEKTEHIVTVWQDIALANTWKRDAHQLANLTLEN